MDAETRRKVKFLDRIIGLLGAERNRILSQWNPTEQDEKVFSSLADGILKSGFNRVSVQSSNWAGMFVLEAIGEDPGDPNNRETAAEMLNRIVTAGHLRVGLEYSPRRGRHIPIYEAA